MARDHLQEYESYFQDYFHELPQESFETAHCILCGREADQANLFIKSTMFIVKCRCGFIFNKRQPTEETLLNFYKTSKAMKTWADYKISPEEDRRQIEKFEKAVEWVHGNPVRRVVDLACGTGKFLNMLDVPERSGVETHPGSAEFARKSGATIFEQTIEDFHAKHERAYFDVVSAWGILEHHKDPLWLLGVAKELLRPGGHVIICVPNAGSKVVQRLWEKCFTFCPQHLWYFDKDRLQDCFEEVGFRVTDYWTIQSEVAPIFAHKKGYPPYSEIPEWDAPEDFEYQLAKNRIIGQHKGYKIVMIGKKL